MRPLVLVIALCALILVACQTPGPSGPLEVQPAVGAEARVVAGPEVRLLVSVGERHLRWGILEWAVGTEAAAAITLLAR